MPVQNGAENLEGQTGYANQTHQPLSLQFLQRWQSFVDDLRQDTRYLFFNCCLSW